MSTSYKTLTVSHIKEEAPGVKEITFTQGADQVTYKPGQYLTLVLPTKLGEIRRSYSITSAPALNEPLAVGVKRIPNGAFSRFLTDTLQVGDRLLTTGAGGFFTLPDELEKYKQVFFLAAGSGITPIFSLLKTVLYTCPDLKVVLVYSNSTKERTMFREPLEQLAETFKDRLHIEFLYSNSADLARARLHKELLHDLLRTYAHAPFSETLFYICGPLNYRRLCFYTLRQADVPLENIRREIFNTEQAMPVMLPPDTEPHHVTILFRGQEYRLEVQHPTTILQAARAAGITLSYSCETGRCGNCVAKCTSGEVWMANNEVLTEKETAQGLILTCVGYPVGGDAVIELD
ncbi:ferredoxin--NADP reductase [Pontibacter arcticus]|uniref:Ring-1,2-phenylacetyl-CoA epoxidase subunit PaaE n=1 Tax=Pontibacter arcticus TaxID=2080288 RepID=A0A364RC07_9BACT|nr:ferredoxin--NADP reductase [Pontibacter arcticus]RAU81797.1 hypothetical protein DP923_13950 [Pontibacter arcticus]